MMPAPRRLILASASPRRGDLLRGLGVAFDVVVSGAVEAEGGGAAEVACGNARRKAEAVADLHPEALVLGADTVVSLGSRLFGKPAGRAEAAEMLASLAGRTHEVTTGVCLCCRAAGDCEVFSETTSVRFRALSGEAIADYLARVHVLDKAGAYAIQEHGDALVAEIRGSFTNVVGLPMDGVRRALAARGWKV